MNFCVNGLLIESCSLDARLCVLSFSKRKNEIKTFHLAKMSHARNINQSRAKEATAVAMAVAVAVAHQPVVMGDGGKQLKHKIRYKISHNEHISLALYAVLNRNRARPKWQKHISHCKTNILRVTHS